MILWGVGSRFESDEQQGIAHFAEHMFFKGGQKFPNAQAVAQAIDAVGGEFNAFTGQEYTAYYTKTAADKLELGLDVLSDMLLHASFPEAELQKERGVIIEEINMYEDMPMRKVDLIMDKLLFGDAPLGRPISGTKETVSRFTVDDFQRYKQMHYTGAQCTVVIAGGVEVEAAQQLVEQYLGSVPGGEKYKPAPAQFIERHNSEMDADGNILRFGRTMIEQKQSEQSHLIITVPGIPQSDPRDMPYHILSIILGGNMSSRLFDSVREKKGLCYYVHAGGSMHTDFGLFNAIAGVDNNRLSQAVTAILDEFRSVVKDGVTDEEVERAKAFSSGRWLLSLEDSYSVANGYAAQDQLENKRETPAEALARLAKVTKEEVQDLAKELFKTEGLRLAVIGPHQDPAELDLLLTI